MRHNETEIAEMLFHTKYEQLGKKEQHVAQHLAQRTHITRNIAQDLAEQSTFGQRLADKVASFGGSWTFISLFAVVLFVWILLNSFILVKFGNATFDPYPYILLNLFLSMLAAIQAPIILMSQNRQAYKDRMSAEHDYEINLKAELEILTLHEKMDLLKDKQWSELVLIQEDQLTLLKRILSNNNSNQ